MSGSAHVEEAQYVFTDTPIPALNVITCYHFLAAFTSFVVVFVLADEKCVLKVEWTRKSLRLYGCLYVTRGEFGTFTKCLGVLSLT